MVNLENNMALFNCISNIPRRVSVVLEVTLISLQKKVIPTASAKRVFSVMSGIAFLLFVFSPSVFATSLGDMMDTLSGEVDKSRSLVVKGGGLLAVLGVLTVGLKIKQRSREGENSHVKVSHIVGLLLGSIICGATAAVLYRSGGSVGLSESDYGQVPGN